MRHVTTRAAGLIILIAGVWGGLIPFVGPYFHFTLGPDHTWTWSANRLYLDVLPAAAAVVGGLFLIGGGLRPIGKIGALLALAGGVWFAVGPDVSYLWHAGGAQGVAHGGKVRRIVELLTFHSGLGVLITAFAAFALPGLAVLRRREVPATAAAAGTAAPAGAGPADGRRSTEGAPAREPAATDGERAAADGERPAAEPEPTPR
jgi:hypothetical protein